AEGQHLSLRGTRPRLLQAGGGSTRWHHQRGRRRAARERVRSRAAGGDMSVGKREGERTVVLTMEHDRRYSAIRHRLRSAAYYLVADCERLLDDPLVA